MKAHTIIVASSTILSDDFVTLLNSEMTIKIVVELTGLMKCHEYERSSISRQGGMSRAPAPLIPVLIFVDKPFSMSSLPNIAD